MTSQEFKKIADKLPDSPGVYFFLGSVKSKSESERPAGREGGDILYIGKATSLRDRVKSYFGPDLIKTRGPRLVDMVTLATKIDFTPTDSVLEALLLEANLIKHHQPKYNSDEKDNKSYNYVIITDEDFPKVMMIRGRTLLSQKVLTHEAPDERRKPISHSEPRRKYVFGPFPHGGQLKEAMKIIRRIFPYRDARCVPYPEQVRQLEARGHIPPAPGRGKPCFNRQIGLCPGVCVGEISKEEYAEQIQRVRLFFEGKKKTLIKMLEKDMKNRAAAQEFEKAAEIRKTIFALNHIQDIALLKQENRLEESSGGGFGATGLPGSTAGTFRIEAYDVAHMSGKNVVGVMTVVENGEVNKAEYRKFRIRLNPGVNDIAALKEIIRRRLGHPEWAFPNLIVVDGNQSQINAAKLVLKERRLVTPVVSVVKDERHKAREILGDKKYAETHSRSIILANSEAHRFAITYHRRRRDRL